MDDEAAVPVPEAALYIPRKYAHYCRANCSYEIYIRCIQYFNLQRAHTLAYRMFGSPNSRHHTIRSNLSFNYSSLTYDVCLLGYAYYCTVVCLFKANFMIIQQYLPMIYFQVNLHTQLVMLALRIMRASPT